MIKRVINVLICDDSALMRRNLKKIIESDPELRVIGFARDGEDAVIKARELRPDVVTMDVNMPEMDGITALQIITQEGIAPVLMISALTQKGAEATFEAMALGAFDYVPKPGGTVSVQMGSVAPDIIRKIKAASLPGIISKLSRKTLSTIEKPGKIPRKSSPSKGFGFKAVAIGISTGGPKTLFDVLPFLPADLPAAVFLVQHMPPQFISSYARRIDSKCRMRCIEAEVGMKIEPGAIYLAKGGHHLIPYLKPNRDIVIRLPKRPEHAFIPSADVMMNAVLEVFGADTVGVLMTGMGNDGAAAMVNIRKAGGITIAESQESAIVFGMPAEAIEMGGAEIVAPSWDIAEEIIKAVE